MNPYNEPHYVVLLFEQTANAGVTGHQEYYEALDGFAKTIHYGEVINDNALSVIIYVASQEAFEHIITHDPALTSGLFELKQVIPYVNRAASVIPPIDFADMFESLSA